MGRKKSSMTSAPPPISLLEIASSSSGSFVSPAGKAAINKNGISPTAATVAETPSPSSACMTSDLLNLSSPPTLQVTALEESPVQQLQPPTQKPSKPFDENSPGKGTSPVKPFDEAVDDGFNAAWGEEDDNKDSLYVLSSMMKSQLAKEEEDKRDITLSFLAPGSPSPKDIATTYYGQPLQQQQNTTLSSIEETPLVVAGDEASGAKDTSVASNLTPLSIGETDDVSKGTGNDSHLLALTPTNPNQSNITDGYSLKPHALFNSAQKNHGDNKENIPPSDELSEESSPHDEPGKLRPAPVIYAGPKKISSGSMKSNEDMPWDCVEDFGAYDDDEREQLMKMADLEAGCLETRRSALQRAFKKSAEHLKAKENLRTMRKMSSIHPPEIIEFEIKSNSGKELFEDEPLASLNLAAGDTGYHDLDRSLVDPPRFPIGNSPRKSRKRDSFADHVTKQRLLRKSFYCVLLAILVASAVVVVLFASGRLQSNNNTGPVDWQSGPEGEVEPFEELDTSVPVEYVPDSNLFEGDEIVACTNAEHLNEMDRPYFGSTWKSFWDARINSCGDQMSTGYSIWYTFSTNSSKLVEASTCNNADFDTQITVLSGSCSELECISFNDQACGSQSAVTWFAEANRTYYVMVSGYREASGTFGLTLADAVNNDDCFEAMGPLVPGSVVAGTTAGAQNVDMPSQCGDVDMSAPGVWYEIANVTGFFRAEILRGSTDFNGQVSVYRSMDEDDAGCGAMLCDKSSVTGNVTWLAEGRETYYLFVNGVNGTMGDFDLFFGQDRPSTCEEARQLDPNTIGYLASTQGANPQNVESCGYTGYHTAPGLWFSVEGTGKILEVSTCGNLQNLDTQISVFANGCDSLQCIGGTGQDYPCGNNGKVSWKSESGQVYHIFVSGRSSRVGDFVLDIEEISQQDGYTCPASVALDMGSTSYLSSTIDAPSSPVSLCDGNAAVRGVWHEVVGTGKVMRISVCNDDTDFDARVSLYTGSCDNLACVANTQSRCGEKNEILVTTHVGHKYYLFVHGPDSFSLGNYRLDVDETIINDTCETAPTLQLSPARYFGSTMSADLSIANECGESETDSTALWYRMLGTGETATLSTCSAITDFSTDITVYTGSCGSLFCVDNGGTTCGDQSSISFQTSLNEIYYVRIGGNTTDDVGNFVMDVSNMSPFFGSG